MFKYNYKLKGFPDWNTQEKMRKRWPPSVLCQLRYTMKRGRVVGLEPSSTISCRTNLLTFSTLQLKKVRKIRNRPEWKTGHTPHSEYLLVPHGVCRKRDPGCTPPPYPSYLLEPRDRILREWNISNKPECSWGRMAIHFPDLTLQLFARQRGSQWDW